MMLDHTSSRKTPSGPIEFDVAICTWNRKDILERSMAAVFRELEEYPSARLIVVDNASTDSTPEMLRSWAEREPKLKVLREPKQGNYYAIVTAMREMRGSVMIFVDDDAMPCDGCFKLVLSEFEEHPRTGYVGVSIEGAWLGPQPNWMSARMIREIPIISWPSGRSLCCYPHYPPSVMVGLRCIPALSLFAADERRDVGLGWGGGNGKFIAVGGDDHDLAEIYHQNGMDVVALGDAVVQHQVVVDKLTPEWVLRRFSSEGRLRVRFGRLSGRGAITRHTVPMLMAFPLLLISLLARPIMPDWSRLLTTAYFQKSLCAWRELLFGPRSFRFPYREEARCLVPAFDGVDRE
jgi:glycosyltransferase involved in cell wall biosynthesis